ncbi:CARDB domain-containing protein [Paenibacillus hexagrammi]|uniref:CARDB domain-containing protein n=1 Tax=Paenibacillus hexagrammi TaxID=2908839 RepID=A0ABY3STK4_9BACL|nr:CARDB domain-containing protein [Paenibacillus sp. YPD9-1]UJF36415.1 hypothetical protein L0M14_19470 [Paenibacillus sp. YPD9-1]
MKKCIRYISVLMLVILGAELDITQFLGEELVEVFAASPSTVTAPIDFPSDIAKHGSDGKYYSTNNYLSGGIVSITNVPEGNVIQRIWHHGEDVTPPAAIGVKDYIAPVNDTHTFAKRKVVSTDNTTGTRGYYAWYRYIPGGSQGLNWYADVFDKSGNPVKISCGPSNIGPAKFHRSSSAPTEDIKGYHMPKFPGCSSTDFGDDLQSLSLGAQRDSDRPFTTDDAVTIPDSAVYGVIATSADVNEDNAPIPGPNSQQGLVRSSSIPDSSIEVAPNTNDAGQYRVTFQQQFTEVTDKESTQEINTPPNGAKVITYYEAFKVDLQGYTNQYDGEVIVEYGPPPNVPNLVAISVTAPSCVEVNKTETYTFTLANSGGTDITTPFQAKVVIDGTTFKTYDYTGLAAGASKTENFTKNFGGTSGFNVAVIVDTVTGENNPSDNSKAITVTPKSTCAPAEIPPNIDGDFSIEKTTLPYGRSNTMLPVGVAVTGSKDGVACKMTQFGFIFEQDGIIRDYVDTKSSATTQGFSGPPYPGGMGEGQVNVKMKIVSSCGNEKIVGPKTFTITIPPNNNPPFGSPGWFARGNTNNYPDINEVVVGNYVDLGIIKDKSKTPEEPYDPEGDGFFPTWDFSGSTDPWIQNLGDSKNGYGFYEHDERFSNIKADVLGSHTVKMKLTDTRGSQSSWRSATINVVKPNPIAACEAPTQMKSNRPLAPSAINADKSRSPLGLTIDHSKDEWTNKQSTYSNTGSSDITVTVTLNKVYDSNGLASENTSSCNIIVHPDAPPFAKINAPALGIRGEEYEILNESTSPDGDTLTQTLWWYRYDANNDGTFNDVTENWVPVTGTMSKYIFNPGKVGKYKFKLRTIEEYGAYAEAESGVMDVINQAPEVSFDLSGNEPNPDSNLPTSYKASDILSNWTLVASNSNTLISKSPVYNWENDNEALTTGAGKGKEKQYPGINLLSNPSGPSEGQAYNSPLADNGFGKNGLSVYKAMTAPTPAYSQPLLLPVAEYEDGAPTGNYIPGSFVSGDTQIESDRTHLYFKTVGESYGSTFYALNKNKIGKISQTVDEDDKRSCSDCLSTYTYHYHWLDGNPYDYWLNYTNLPTDNLLQEKEVPYYSNGSQTSTVKVKENIEYSSVTQTFTEKTVYMTFAKNTPRSVSYSSGKNNYYYNTVWMVCTYNAMDGVLIGCFDRPGSNVTKATLNKGDHIVFLFDSQGSYSSNGFFGDSYAEVDRYGNVVDIADIPVNTNNPWISVTYEKKYQQYGGRVRSYDPPRYLTTSCHFNQYYTNNPYTDMEGNFYFYEEKVCTDSDGSIFKGTDWNYRNYPELEFGIYVAKYDKNFNLVWRARTGGNSLFFSGSFIHNWKDNLQNMIVNPMTRTLITKTLYTVPSGYTDDYSIINNTISMDTGAVWGWGSPQLEGMSFPMHPDGSGNLQSGTCAATIFNQCSNINTAVGRRIAGTVSHSSTGTDIRSEKPFSEYMGDGLLLSSYMYYSFMSGAPNNPPTGNTVYWIDKGPVAEAVPIIPRYQFGQFISPNAASDTEILFNFKTEQNKVDTEKFGFSFRMQDGMNRYAIEFDGSSMYLAKYVGGVRTVLASSVYNLQDSKSYNVKVRTMGNTLNVWVNKVNYFSDIVDNTYPIGGRYGPFSDKSFVTFSGMSTKPYAETAAWDSDYAILNEETGKAELKYDDVVMKDPENDPMAGSFSWTYTHTPMFIDNGELSSLSGQSFSSGQPVLDRVGRWDVTLQAMDDPYPLPMYKFPNMTFDPYRKASNTFKKSIIVHRRPIAEFTLNMESDGSVTWKDTSYDPDRYNAATSHYEPGYVISRGIVERRYWYIAPDGTSSNTQLTRVTDSGTYIVGLQVKDEFGAWSWQAVNTLDVGLKPNHLPQAVLTFPDGSHDTPSYLQPGTYATIQWAQTDMDLDTTYTAYEVMYSSCYISGWSGQETCSDQSYSQTFSTKQEAWSWFAEYRINGSASEKWKVKVRVKDEVAWSPWSNEGWLGSQRPPTVELTYPTGTYETPTQVAVTKPTITWNQQDEDTGRISYQQIRLWSEDNRVLASADISVPAANRTKLSDSWTVNVDLPVGSKVKVQVRVMNEQSVWSDWSQLGWMVRVVPVQSA